MNTTITQPPAVSRWWKDSIGYPDAKLAILARVHDKHVVILFSNMKHIKVPLYVFVTPPGGPRPDFNRLSVNDWGHTICFGDYQAAVEDLYEVYYEGPST